MISWHIKDQVIEKLNKHFNKNSSPLFTVSNVCLSCTHTHSATGGGQENVLYQLAHFGYIKELVDNVVNGISESIIDAYNKMQPCRLETIKGNCTGVSMNRSPSAYDQNPLSEQKLYSENIDTEMFMLKIIALQTKSSKERPLAMINWLPVHPVCLNMTNPFVSGDNKGLASYYFERYMVGSARIPSSQLGNHFVAAFAQEGNEGDVTPNIIPATCDEPDDPERNNLVCNRNPHVCSSNSVCKGNGPGKDTWKWLETNARMQYNTAKKLFESPYAVHVDLPETIRRNPLAHVGIYWNMTRAVACGPAFGYSTLAGTTDGPGPSFLGIWQGDLDPEVGIINYLRDTAFERPTEFQKKCQAPKPIALDFEYLNSKSEEYRWMHDHLELQLFRIGSIFIYSSPIELSTMSGRRIKRAMKSLLKKHYGNNIEIVITGLANQYAGYMTTREEYQIQRYEGASTLWGPSSLDALIDGYGTITKMLLEKESKGKFQKDDDLICNTESLVAANTCSIKTHLSYQLRLVFPHNHDELPNGCFFGKILNTESLKKDYLKGDTVQVVFQGASPRHNFSHVPTFLNVEYYQPTIQEWIVVYDDGDPCTRYWFAFDHIFSLVSTVTITWFIDPKEHPGLYRIRYLGKYKSRDRQFHDINSVTLPFSVI